MWFQPSSDNPLARLQAANGQVLGSMSVRKKRNSGASPPTVCWTHNIHIKWSCASMQIWAWSHLQTYLRTCHEQSYKITLRLSKSNLYNNYLQLVMGKKWRICSYKKNFSACGSLCILRTEDKDPVLSLWQRPVGSSVGSYLMDFSNWEANWWRGGKCPEPSQTPRLWDQQGPARSVWSIHNWLVYVLETFPACRESPWNWLTTGLPEAQSTLFLHCKLHGCKATTTTGLCGMRAGIVHRALMGIASREESSFHGLWSTDTLFFTSGCQEFLSPTVQCWRHLPDTPVLSI